MRVLFKPISVLLSYNEYLINKLEDLGVEIYIDKPDSFFAEFLYFLEKSKRKLKGRVLPTWIGLETLRYAALRHLLKRNEVDIIHLNSLNFPKKALLEAKARGLPVVFVLHLAPMNEELYRSIEEYVDVYVAPSEFTLRTEGGKLRCRAVIIHHGIDVTEFRPLSKSLSRTRMHLPLNRKIVLWNDRISPEKDLKTLLEAIPLVLREFRDTFFYVKGRGVNNEYFSRLTPLLRDLKLRYGSNVKIKIGWISQSMLPFCIIALTFSLEHRYVKPSVLG